MKKILKLATVMLIMMVVLTGCVQVNYDVKINEDGSSDISYIYAFTKNYLNDNNINSEDATKPMQNTAIENGYTVEEYSDDTMTGFKATKHLENVSEISMQEAFGEEYIVDKEEEKIKIEKSKGNTVYSQNAKIDLTEMSGMESFLTMKYTITLPVAVRDNNANEVSKDGKTLTWNLNAGEVTEIQFKAIKSGIVSLIIKIILIVIIGVGVIFAIIKIIKKIKETDKTEKPIKNEETEKIINKEKKETIKKDKNTKKDNKEK